MNHGNHDPATVTQVGAVFLAAAALMLLGLMRDWFPRELRTAVKVTLAMGVTALLAMAVRNHAPRPSWPAVLSLPRPAAPKLSSPAPVRTPQPKSAVAAPAPAPRGGFRGTIREITPEEEAAIEEQIRTRAIPVER